MSSINTAVPSEQQTGAVKNEAQIAHWLRQYIANIFGLPPEEIAVDATFNQMGLDSASAVAMTGDLGDWAGCDIDPSSAYEHATILKLSHAVAGELARSKVAQQA
jgi:acyl carrier protein